MDIQAEYNSKKKQIKSRLKEFQNLSEKEYIKEHLFCILTPQSQAQKCWSAVQELSKIKNPTEEQIYKILKSRTRFHKTKTKRISLALQNWPELKKDLSNPDIVGMRNNLAKKVNGYGLKEASHFLRNIGLSQNKIAILDRHIIKHLKVEKIKSPKHYLEVEKQFLQTAEKLKIPADELDLVWWSKENGEIFK